MNLLPKSHADFSSVDYWDKFFKKRGSEAFEWYGEYPDLCGVLHKYIKPSDNILVIGCGNSQLSADMYDVGYQNITNIDISEVVIKQMAAKNAEQRPDMKFLQMDLMKMEFEDNTFSVILDKGTLDAIMTDDTEKVSEDVDKMFRELCRVLRLGGRYICVSLAQDHILKKVVNFFPHEGWPLRIHRVSVQPKDTEGHREFQMPVFLYVCTKFKKMPNMKQILEVCQLEDQVSRLESTDEMTTAVKEMQHYAMVRQQINKRSHPDDQIVLHLYGPTSSTSPRYTLHVVDSDRNGRDNVFAIFIAPEGRETEWLFSTNEGRKQLSESAGFQRLVVVLLHRDHSYIDMENIKAELSGKVMELAPAELKNKTQVPFLSLGDGIGHRTIKHRGKSNTSGDYVIEDVESDNKELVRRLVFLSNPSLVQSEARLKQETSKKKSGKKKNVKRLVVDSSFLSCQHHSTITAGMALLGDFEKSLDSGLQMAIIGLGGGGLPLFIHDHFPKVSLDIVEIDDTVVSIAKEWFGFGSVTEERVHVFVKDGQDYVKELAAAGETKDVIIFDIDSKDSSVGMSSPPKGFVEAEFLKDVEKTLHSEGVFILNLVCRDKSLRESVVQNLKSVFKTVLNVKIPDEVNEIVFCLSNSRQSAVEGTQDSEILPETVTGALKKLQDSVDLKSNAAAYVVNLTCRLEGLHIL